MNMNLKRKKKKDFDCNFYHVSLLVPYPNKFLVVCLCILSFHDIHKYLFVYPQIFFLYWGELKFFLGERARPFSSIKPSMTNYVNSRIVDGTIICFMCIC